jgi:hypothetical protein
MKAKLSTIAKNENFLVLLVYQAAKRKRKVWEEDIQYHLSPKNQWSIYLDSAAAKTSSQQPIKQFTAWERGVKKSSKVSQNENWSHNQDAFAGASNQDGSGSSVLAIA